MYPPLTTIVSKGVSSSVGASLGGAEALADDAAVVCPVSHSMTALTSPVGTSQEGELPPPGYTGYVASKVSAALAVASSSVSGQPVSRTMRKSLELGCGSSRKGQRGPTLLTRVYVRRPQPNSDGRVRTYELLQRYRQRARERDVGRARC